MVALGYVVMTLYSVTTFSDMCGNRVVSRTPSPGGSYDAVLFERDCGATTGSATQISLVDHGAMLPNKPGNVFVAGEAGVELKWQDADRLEVTYDPAFRVFLQNRTVKGVLVTYKTF